MKNAKVKQTLKIKSKENFLKIISNKETIESSSLYLDLSESLLNKIDLYFSNTDLTKKQQLELIKLFEEVYGESYINSISD